MGSSGLVVAMKTLFHIHIFILIPLSWGQQDLPCPKGSSCTPRGSCVSYKSKIQQLRTLTKGTNEYRIFLSELKGLICNQSERKVCCKKETSTYSSTDPSSPLYLPSAKKAECGFSGNAEFIVGGEDTKLGEFPWMVLLRRQRASDRVWWHCGGSLINKWFVISAAHCGQVDQVRVGEWKVIDTNKFDRKDCLYYDDKTEAQCDGARFCRRRCRFENAKIDCIPSSQGEKVCSEEVQDIEVEKSIPHPKYSSDSGIPINDIMLIKLIKPVTYNKFAKPICFPDISFTQLLGEPENTNSYKRIMVVGWGKTNTAADGDIKTVSTANQQKLRLPLVSIDECKERFLDLGADLNFSSKYHLCAGGVQGKDSCNGDSGGPLIMQVTDITPYQLIGVVSGGTARCAQGVPGIYTRFSEYVEWVKETMKTVTFS